MYYGKKKGIIITIVIIILLIVIAVGGVMLYLFTDLFKSNQTLFLKYIDQTIQGMKYETNDQTKDIIEAQKENPYQIKGTLSFDYDGNENQQAEVLKQMKVELETNANGQEEKSYTKASILYQNQNLFNLEYANSNDIYALKSDEIVTAFIGVRNSNLKVLAQKLGMQDTSNIPDSITPIDYEDLLNISEEEKQHISDTYLPVIVNNIEKSKYSKQSNIPITKEGVEYNTTSYRVDLTSEDIANISVKLLETLKQDSITLNFIATKAKILNLPEEYTQVNNLTKQIDEQIKKIENSEKSPENGVSIVVYEEKGQTVLTEIIVKNNVKFTLYTSNTNQKNSIYLMAENLSTSNDYNTVEMQVTQTKTAKQTNTEILVNKDNDKGIEIYLTNEGLSSDEKVTTTCEINYNDGNDKYIANYEQEINFNEENEIISLDNTNCAILNDYPTDQLSMLIVLIAQQTQNVMNQKMQQLGIQTTNQTEQIITIEQNTID